MSVPTPAAERMRSALEQYRGAVEVVLGRYGASGLCVFGSVARGDAREDSNLDLLVDLEAGPGDERVRLTKIGQELSEVLGASVDVVTADLLPKKLARSALADAVPL